jgi:hypothetical protein
MATVVVSLSANHVLLTRTEAGSVAWSEPAVRSVSNLGAAVEKIVVELKQAGDPAIDVAKPPATPPAKVLNDPWHRWAMENQYVCVYDVRIRPG